MDFDKLIDRLNTLDEKDINDVRKEKLLIWIDNQERIFWHKRSVDGAKLLLEDVHIEPRDFKEYCDVREEKRKILNTTPKKLKGPF